VPWDVTGSGSKEVTDEVDTGTGDEVDDIVDVANSRCRVIIDDAATMACKVSCVELASRAIEVGAGVLGGRRNVCDILVTSEERTKRFVAVEAMTPLSSDHNAVTVEGMLTFRTTCDRRGE
jgi:hypothetical protein